MPAQAPFPIKGMTFHEWADYAAGKVTEVDQTQGIVHLEWDPEYPGMEKIVNSWPIEEWRSSVTVDSTPANP